MLSQWKDHRDLSLWYRDMIEASDGLSRCLINDSVGSKLPPSQLVGRASQSANRKEDNMVKVPPDDESV